MSFELYIFRENCFFWGGRGSFPCTPQLRAAARLVNCDRALTKKIDGTSCNISYPQAIPCNEHNFHFPDVDFHVTLWCVILSVASPFGNVKLHQIISTFSFFFVVFFICKIYSRHHFSLRLHRDGVTVAATIAVTKKKSESRSGY